MQQLAYKYIAICMLSVALILQQIGKWVVPKMRADFGHDHGYHECEGQTKLDKTNPKQWGEDQP